MSQQRRDEERSDQGPRGMVHKDVLPEGGRSHQHGTGDTGKPGQIYADLDKPVVPRESTGGFN